MSETVQSTGLVEYIGTAKIRKEEATPGKTTYHMELDLTLRSPGAGERFTKTTLDFPIGQFLYLKLLQQLQKCQDPSQAMILIQEGNLELRVQEFS